MVSQDAHGKAGGWKGCLAACSTTDVAREMGTHRAWDISAVQPLHSCTQVLWFGEGLWGV